MPAPTYTHVSGEQRTPVAGGAAHLALDKDPAWSSDQGGGSTDQLDQLGDDQPDDTERPDGAATPEESS